MNHGSMKDDDEKGGSVLNAEIVQLKLMLATRDKEIEDLKHEARTWSGMQL